MAQSAVRIDCMQRPLKRNALVRARASDRAEREAIRAFASDTSVGPRDGVAYHPRPEPSERATSLPSDGAIIGRSRRARIDPDHAGSRIWLGVARDDAVVRA